MTKKIPLGFALAITLLAMTATLSVTMLLAMNIFNDTVESVTEREDTFSKLSEVDSIVRNNYLGVIDEQRLMDMISTGYLSGISDSAAKYYNPEQYSEYLAQQAGEIVGIGATVAVDATGYLRVLSVTPESPAAEAAMDEGSIIKAIGGTDTKGMSVATADILLNGRLGSEVQIVWQAAGTTEDITTNLLRRSYIIPTVEYSNQSGDTGYIKVLQFNDNLASELDFAINNLIQSGSTGLVIDIRGISQNSISSVARVADIFVDSGEIATLLYNDDSTESIYLSNDAKVTMPIVLLVNEQTSGAAELLAITLRDYAGAKVVGEATAGSSGISEIFHLSDGSAVELTVAQVIPLRSESYAAVGIPIDFEVLLTPEQELYFYNLGFSDDPQYVKAVEMLNTLKTEAGIELTPEEILQIPDNLINPDSSSADSTSNSQADSEQSLDTATDSDISTSQSEDTASSTSSDDEQDEEE